MSEEQLRILKMIEEKKISAEDGAKLLNALNTAQAARERAAQAQEAARTERNRWDAGGWGWGNPGPVPPTPPTGPLPPTPPMPPMDPFAFAFGRSGRSARDEARERRRGRRDTESLESEIRESTGGARFFRIKVTDAGTNHTMVNVNLPVGLINFGLKLAGRYIPEESGIDFEAVTEAIQQGAVGKIIDVQQGSEDGAGTRVEIYVD
jgi:hypothetical protein